jgi:UvrD-like helicase C-terminal domain
VDDIPLLDAADALLNGRPPSYEHIVVDEAQDLSPLQLDSIRRRSRSGSMTVLGDLAQATSPWAHESWDEVVEQLRHNGVSNETVELELGYRLPAEVHEVAMRLLPEVAPTLQSPRAVRRTGHDVMVTTTGASELAAVTVATIRDLLGTGLIGVVCPAAVRAELAHSLDVDGLAWSPELRAATSPVVVLGADEVKGLEFDCVVVVEPAQIVAEAEHGLRSLFVALTRCTSRLAIVHAKPLPDVLGLAGDRPEVPAPESDAEQAGDGVVVDLAGRADDESTAVVVNLQVVDDDEPSGAVVVDLAQALGQAAAIGAEEGGILDPIDAAIARDAFDGLERQIAQAIAATVAERIIATIRPELLGAVADELAVLLRRNGEDRRG